MFIKGSFVRFVFIAYILVVTVVFGTLPATAAAEEKVMEEYTDTDVM